MKKALGLVTLAVSIGVLGIAAPASAQDGKLRIIAFGAHPDDGELGGAGRPRSGRRSGITSSSSPSPTATSATGRKPAGRSRAAAPPRSQESAKILGITTQVLDIHDGELVPTLENRRTITRLIREWKADIVIGHRPNDYHPDHRYVGLLVQDAAYMVTVPFFCPDTPHLERNPVFLYFQDSFQKPNPFTADVVVAIDDVIDKKLAATAGAGVAVLRGRGQRRPATAAGRRRRQSAAAERGSGAVLATASPARRRGSGPSCASGTGRSGATPSSTPRRSRSASTAAGRTPRRSGGCFRSSLPPRSRTRGKENEQEDRRSGETKDQNIKNPKPRTKN